MSATPATGGAGGTQQTATSHHHCSECGIMFDSAASLQVHLHYHQEAMMSRASWGPPTNNSGSPTDPDNNNHAPKKGSNVIAAADSSDNQMVNVKQEPGVTVKQESAQQQQQQTQQQQQQQQQPQQHAVNPYHAASPYDLPPHQQYSPNYGYDVYYGIENPYMAQDFMGKHPSQPIHQQQQHRYQPYQHSPRVSSSSPSSAPGVCIPSPSPVQCDKCGMVCETATQLQEHALSHSDAFQYPPMPTNSNSASAKDSSSEILDLDSHKVVYPAVLPSIQGLQGMQPQWQDPSQPPPHQLYHQPAFPPQSASQDIKLFRTSQELSMQQQGMQQASHPPHMVSPPDFPTTTTPQQHDNSSGGGFRPTGAAPQITSSHPVVPGAKGPGWKSNEARRPKTYNCTACNKWFTSSGHLKRHYNTTLHKNAVKSSGQPDPANMPISAHHHPGRDPNHPSHHKGGGSPTRRIQNQQRSPEPQGFPPQNQQSPGPGGYILPHSYGAFTFPGIPPDTGQPPPGELHHQQQQIESNNTGASTTNHLSGSPPNGQAGPSVHNLLPIPRGLQTHNSVNSNTINTMEETTSTCHMQPASAQLQHPAQSARSLISYRRPRRPPHTTMHTTDMHQDLDQHQVTSNQEGQEDQEGSTTTTSTLFLVIPPGNRITSSLHTIGDASESVVALRGPQEAATPMHQYGQMDQYGLLDPLQHPPFSPAIPEQEPSPPSPPQRVTSSEPDTKPVVLRCEPCDKYFNKACYLTQHNKSFHSGDKPYKCGRCGKRFITDTIYEEHIAKHAGEKPFKCAECPKQFNHKTDLRRHMCLHSGSKPYACHLCGKGFVRKDHMLKHCETHRKKPREHGNKRAAAVQA